MCGELEPRKRHYADTDLLACPPEDTLILLHLITDGDNLGRITIDTRP